MSQFASPQQVLKVVQGQRTVLDQQFQRLSEVERYHQTERQKVLEQRDQAAADLGRALLPALDPPSIARAAQITGLVGLPQENLPGQRESRRAWLSQRLSEITHDPRYRDRELLRHPRTGSLVTALADATEQRRPLADVVDRCESHMRWTRLLELGWGTEEQKAPWWRFSYWSDRSAAAEIVAQSGKASFAEVREEYRVAKETVATYDAELARLRGEMAAGEALDAEYAKLYEEYTNLDQWALDAARVRLVRHMLSADTSLMNQRVAAHKDVRLLFLTTSGLAAKVGYLDGIHGKHANEMRDDLNAQKSKLDAIHHRAAYKGRGMPYDKLQALAVDRRERYDKRFARWGKTYNTVYVYDRWDRGRWYGDLLWWDLMTRGRLDGSYIHDVHVFHHTHPEYVYDPSPPHHPVHHDQLSNDPGHGDDGRDGDDGRHGDDGSDTRDDGDAAAASADDARDGGGDTREDMATDAS